MSEEPTNGHDLNLDAETRNASQPPAEATPRVLRLTIFQVDGDWPDLEVGVFECAVRMPAVLKRAYPVRDGEKIVMRLVFVVCPDAPAVVQRFMTTPLGKIIGVREGDPQPNFLEVLVDPRSGAPVGLWQVPAAEETPKGNDLAPAAGEIEAR